VTTDLFIIGGGPAGLATAIAARRRGLRVIVFDVTSPPADKACGEGLMPDGLAALAQLGVRISESEGFPFSGIRFVEGELKVTAEFPSRPGLGIRRTTLHRILQEHAASAGAELRWGESIDFGSVRAAWMIGADGENSLVRRWSGLERVARERRRFGFRRHYAIAPWTDRMELYWADRCQVYITPVSADSVCVAVLSADPHLRLDEALQNFPELEGRLRPEKILTSERGAISASRRLASIHRGRVALVGDASGSVDAITGEGLCLAFRQASALVESIEFADLSRYQRRHRQITRRAGGMATLLLALADYRHFRRATLRMLAAHPDIFARLLAFHVGASTESDTASLSGNDNRVWARGA